MVTKFAPLPANDGGKQRALAMATRLAQRFDTTLVAHDDGADRNGLAELGLTLRLVPWQPSLSTSLRGAVRARSWSAGRFLTPRLEELVAEAVKPPPDLLLVVYSQLAPLVARHRAGLRVVDLQNVESDLVAAYGRTRGPLRGAPARFEALALRRLERRAFAAADVVSVVSDADRERLPAAPREIVVTPNGWDVGEPLPPATGPTAAFVASLGWPPNVDAAVWFTNEVWPDVVARVRGARLLLVGRDPAPEVRALASEHILVTGTVPDVRPYLSQARIALAPLRVGGGSRLKILEALAGGRPVVATAIGAEGLEDLVGRGVVVADGAASLAARVAELLERPDEANVLGERGRAEVSVRYGWDRTLASLMERVSG